MSAKLIFFDFVTEQGTPNSPCAINASQIVYMYTTQSTKTAVVFTNGDLMVANQTLASFKSGELSQGLGEFVSIGTPDSCNKAPWGSSKGEVLVNTTYLSQVQVSPEYKTLVQLNQPSSFPVSFVTQRLIDQIVSDSKINESPFNYISLDVTQTSTNAPVINSVYSNVELTATQVTGSRSAAGTYALAFPTGTPIGTSPSFFVSSPTGATSNPIVKISATSATGLGIVTQGSGFTDADDILSNTKINILSWPTISVPSSILRIGARMQGGIVFHIDTSARKGYALYEGGFVSTGIVWCTPTGTNVTGVSLTVNPASTGIARSATNTSLIATAATGVGASVSAEAFSATVNGVTYTDWALPSEGALNAIYDSLLYATADPYGLRSIIPPSTSIWSSNQGSSATVARVVTFNASSRANAQVGKSNSFYALAVREFSF
jgi:hypothetical protein